MENKTIRELIDVIKKSTDMTLISENEFEKFILDRRPIELLLMANDIINHGISE